jgi:hypothetical protein
MGKLSGRALVRMLVEAVGLGVALVCIGWVLGHLIAFLSYGYVLIGDTNRLVLSVEVALVSFGLLCFLVTFCMDRF